VISKKQAIARLTSHVTDKELHLVELALFLWHLIWIMWQLQVEINTT